MGKNQRWFKYPHLVIARIPSGPRLSPVITWNFNCSLLHSYYTTVSPAALLPVFALSCVEEYVPHPKMLLLRIKGKSVLARCDTIFYALTKKGTRSYHIS